MVYNKQAAAVLSVLQHRLLLVEAGDRFDFTASCSCASTSPSLVLYGDSADFVENEQHFGQALGAHDLLPP